MGKKDDATQKVSEEALKAIRRTARDISPQGEATTRASAEELQRLGASADATSKASADQLNRLGARTLDEPTNADEERTYAAQLKESMLDVVENFDVQHPGEASQPTDGAGPPAPTPVEQPQLPETEKQASFIDDSSLFPPPESAPVPDVPEAPTRNQTAIAVVIVAVTLIIAGIALLLL